MDCLGQSDGTDVDNIEEVDNIVGWLAEYTRPHGFAISETQFHIFIVNASRRLLSDRFFTSSFRPEFYSYAGVDWVNDNGHVAPVSPMKRVLLRTLPALREELLTVRNAFDPWARERCEYYSLAWQPRRGAEGDPAFAGNLPGQR